MIYIVKIGLAINWLHLDMVGVGGSSPLGRTISSKSISYIPPRLKILTTYFVGTRLSCSSTSPKSKSRYEIHILCFYRSSIFVPKVCPNFSRPHILAWLRYDADSSVDNTALIPFQCFHIFEQENGQSMTAAGRLFPDWLSVIQTYLLNQGTKHQTQRVWL